jgi:hypothetical protein
MPLLPVRPRTNTCTPQALSVLGVEGKLGPLSDGSAPVAWAATQPNDAFRDLTAEQVRGRTDQSTFPQGCWQHGLCDGAGEGQGKPVACPSVPPAWGGHQSWNRPGATGLQSVMTALGTEQVQPECCFPILYYPG